MSERAVIHLDQLLTTAEVAGVLRVDPKTVRKFVSEGRLISEGRGKFLASAVRYSIDEHKCDQSIYFIQMKYAGYVKIGKAKNVQKRLEALQTGNPEPLGVIGSFLTTRRDVLEHEKALHRQFWSYQSNGEWFRPGPWVDDVLSALRQHRNCFTIMEALVG